MTTQVRTWFLKLEFTKLTKTHGLDIVIIGKNSIKSYLECKKNAQLSYMTS